MYLFNIQHFYLNYKFDECSQNNNNNNNNNNRENRMRLFSLLSDLFSHFLSEFWFSLYLFCHFVKKKKRSWYPKEYCLHWIWQRATANSDLWLICVSLACIILRQKEKWIVGVVLLCSCVCEHTHHWAFCSPEKSVSDSSHVQFQSTELDTYQHNTSIITSLSGIVCVYAIFQD